MKLFQIEEPEGGPTDPGAPGAAIGIDASGAVAEVAVSVGGNAVVLGDRGGFEQCLTVPPLDGPAADWRVLFEGARLRAERALARPVTHAVVAVPTKTPGDMAAANIAAAAAAAGLVVLRCTAAADFAAENTAAALAAAMLAEDLAPRMPGEAV